MIIELTGPAGAGKTTLIRALQQRDERIVSGIQLSKLRFLSCLASNTLAMLPAYPKYSQSQWFAWHEMRSMVYLRGWRQLVADKFHNNSIIVFDHGPVFRLAQLQEFGPEITSNIVFKRWWNNMLQHWATTLRHIVWLDAPDDVLLARIRSRSQGHAIKEQVAEEGYQFLTRYRACYEQIITEMTSQQQDLQLLRVDTQQQAVEDIVDTLLHRLNQ